MMEFINEALLRHPTTAMVACSGVAVFGMCIMAWATCRGGLFYDDVD